MDYENISFPSQIDNNNQVKTKTISFHCKWLICSLSVVSMKYVQNNPI